MYAPYWLSATVYAICFASSSAFTTFNAFASFVISTVSVLTIVDVAPFTVILACSRSFTVTVSYVRKIRA